MSEMYLHDGVEAAGVKCTGRQCMWAGVWWMSCAWTAMGAEIKSHRGNLPHASHTVYASNGENITEFHLTEHSPFPLLLFYFPFISFPALWLFSASFFCWVSTLQGLSQINQFCLASFAFERNIGIYKYSHAAISDFQLRDWAKGWAVFLFDHEAYIHVTVRIISQSTRVQQT